MLLLRAFEETAFRIEQMLACSQAALGAPPSQQNRAARGLELMRLESRLLLSGVPPGGEGVVEDALDGGSEPPADVQEAESSENQWAHAQHIEIDGVGRIVAKYSIAHSSTDYSQRLVGHGLTVGGWAPFIEDTIQPALDAGFTRIDLHNPFGRGADDTFMAFDQYLDALVETPKLTENFVELWKPITETGVEVIAYIGSPRHDPIQVGLIDDPDAWWDRALAAVQPMVDAGMSIALDASANATGDLLDVALAEHLRDQGVRVYVEARPAADATHWFDYPLLLREATWENQSPELRSIHVGRHAWDHELTGEVVRIVDDTADGDLDLDTLARVLGDGHSATISAKQLWHPKLGNTTVEAMLDTLGVASLPTQISLQAPQTGEALTYSIVSGPSHGRVDVHPENDSLVTYVPDAYYSGSDAFTFRVTDAEGTSETATITLEVRGFTQPPGYGKSSASPTVQTPAGLPSARMRDLLLDDSSTAAGVLSAFRTGLADSTRGADTFTTRNDLVLDRADGAMDLPPRDGVAAIESPFRSVGKPGDFDRYGNNMVVPSSGRGHDVVDGSSLSGLRAVSAWNFGQTRPANGNAALPPEPSAPALTSATEDVSQPVDPGAAEVPRDPAHSEAAPSADAPSRAARAEGAGGSSPSQSLSQWLWAVADAIHWRSLQRFLLGF